MTFADVVVLLLLALACVLAFRLMRRRKTQSSCSKGCSNCAQCALAKGCTEANKQK